MDRVLCLNCGFPVLYQRGQKVTMGYWPRRAKELCEYIVYVIAVDAVEIHRCSFPPDPQAWRERSRQQQANATLNRSPG